MRGLHLELAVEFKCVAGRRGKIDGSKRDVECLGRAGSVPLLKFHGRERTSEDSGVRPRRAARLQAVSSPSKPCNLPGMIALDCNRSLVFERLHSPQSFGIVLGIC